MKNTIKILMLALFSVLCVSCEKMLDAPTKSSMDESMIFSTPAYAKNAIAGILQSFAETNSYRGRYLPWYGINTDVEVRNGLSGSAAPNDGARLSNYNTNVSNDQMNTVDGNGAPNNAYSMFYQGIERANLAIRGLRTYADLNNWELAQILGEVLTLRAVVYLDLLKGWGNVPARFAPVDSETVYLPRVDRDEVWKQLLADLEEAATLVGWPNENSYTTSIEHVNKCFVKALRARIALMAGGYAMHVGETTMRLSNDPDLSPDKMYAIAKEECLDVINSGYARLQPQGAWANSFEAAFRAVHAETYVAGNENLWELPFADGRGRVIFDLGVKHTTIDKYTGQNRGGSNGPNPIMFYKYRPEDVRRDVTCIPYEWTNGIQVPVNLNQWYYGKYRYEWLPLPARYVTSANDDGLNYLYMRYADVLLMAAEAINELDGPGAAASYLKQIKDRAYPNNPSIVTTEMSVATASKTAFFNAIVDERAKEFCGEMVRKADLIRWNLLTAKMEENRADLQNLHNRVAPYNNVNTMVYYQTAPDGESLIFYGLEPGEIGTPPAGYAEKEWRLTSESDMYKYWERLYVRDPSTQPYWPIWQNVLDGSNGVIVNDPIFQ
ncbi:MAG: RagB/SusD family nutrient uptake outer membrane protein [Bacteroidales bacterium]|nr:RagB/SusD family nutrient uptake outer membrane protein [Bacteroidales bacterium]MCL2133746.1 RagB/SusD family nutrient uptake outer membrane protein [Bacteroidales bacterium]